jgi:DNA gyrase subunit A
VFAITSGGGVIRTRADEVRPTSRATMGVRLINLGDGDAVVGVTRNAESAAGVDEIDAAIDDAEAGDLIDADLADGSAGLPTTEAGSGDNEQVETGKVTASDNDTADDEAADPEQGDS